jgi:hypothetical protein
MQNDHMPDGAGWYWARRPGVHAWHAEFVETVGRRFNAEGEQVCAGHLAVLEADGTEVDLGLYLWGGRIPDPPPLTARLQPEQFSVANAIVTRVEYALDKAKPAARQFVFSTNDEVDVDRIVAIDANCPNSIIHISLPGGGYIRVRFTSDELRAEELRRLRAVRAGKVL